MSTIRIYSPEGSLPYTDAVAYSNAETHVQANDSNAWEASTLLAYHAGDWGHWTEMDSGETADGIPWADYQYDHKSAKRSIRSGWDTEATYGARFNNGDEDGACDVEVQVGECEGRWYIRTTDDAGGSDECDATAYDTESDARSAARDYAQEHDECDGMTAADYVALQVEEVIKAGKAEDGEYVLTHADGTRWDADRYSDRNAAEAAITRWYDKVKAHNPGTDILWHCMDCPVLGTISDEGIVEIISHE